MKTLIICKYRGCTDIERVKYTIVDENGKQMDACPTDSNESINLLEDESYDIDRNIYLDISNCFYFNNRDQFRLIKKELGSSVAEEINSLHSVVCKSEMMMSIMKEFCNSGRVLEYDYVEYGCNRIKYMYNDCVRKINRIIRIIDKMESFALKNVIKDDKRRVRIIELKYEIKKNNLAQSLLSHYEAMLNNAINKAESLTEHIIVRRYKPVHIIGVKEFMERNDIDLVIRF